MLLIAGCGSRRGRSGPRRTRSFFFFLSLTLVFARVLECFPPGNARTTYLYATCRVRLTLTLTLHVPLWLALAWVTAVKCWPRLRFSLANQYYQCAWYNASVPPCVTVRCSSICYTSIHHVYRKIAPDFCFLHMYDESAPAQFTVSRVSGSPLLRCERLAQQRIVGVTARDRMECCPPCPRALVYA